MSSKDIKTLLKEARKAIKEKSFATSLNICKEIIKDDKTNYMAFVFLGISLQETGFAEQAPRAFWKATQIDKTNPLAWNGLENYYQRLSPDDAKEKLVDVYSALLEIETDENKLVDLCEKLTALAGVADNFEKVCFKLREFGDKIQSKNCDEKILKVVYYGLISLFLQKSNLSSPMTELAHEVFGLILNDSKLRTFHHYSEYLRFLHHQERFKTLLTEAEKMHTFYENDSVCLEWICKLYNDYEIERSCVFSDDLQIKIESYCKALLEIQAQSSIGLVTKSILLLKNGDVITAKDCLKHATISKPAFIQAWILLTFCYLKLNFCDNALQAALKAKKLNSKDDLQNTLNILLAEALSKSSKEENWQWAVTICKDIRDPSVYTQVSLVRALIKLNKVDEAKEYLYKLKEEAPLFYILLTSQLFEQQNRPNEALEIFETCDINAVVEKYEQQRKSQTALKILEICNSDLSDWWLEFGNLYWKLENFDKSLFAFLKSAKFNPNSYASYLKLGNYYQKFKDFDKARRCYEKTFRINEYCVEAGIELSKIYRKQKNWDANLLLLQNLTAGKITSENQWVWLQLGLHYTEQEEHSSAIDCLRSLVRFDSGNSHYWETLADAYLARNACTSALKSYEKAAELVSHSLYPLLQIANIKEVLGQHTEAQNDFENILKNNKRYLPALKGLAESYLNHAKEHQKAQLLGLARDCAQNALDNLTVAVNEQSDISCLWKLAGDSCLLVAGLPERYCCMLVLAALAEGKDSTGNKILEKDELYTLASRCYSKAITLSNDNFLIWHDLAVCYVLQAQSSLTQKDQLLEKAFAAVQYCVTNNPTYWGHWNLLGNIACIKEPKNYALAQHAFIKAVSVDCNSAVAWCNLGTLYLVLDDIKLANEAFSQAQRSDSNYGNSWIGQAIIAETMGHEDAMDLFRHSTQLSVHEQGGLGYGYWVCRMLLEASSDAIIYSIHNMHAVPVACDALTWYSESNSNDDCAWNMLGLLLERLGLKSSAAQAFRRALRLTTSDNIDKVRTNYGRLLFKLGQYQQAVKIFKDVKEATFSSGSGLALALFKSHEYEESYEAYESALHWLTEEEGSQSDLLVALASMAYMFQGPDAAKTLLFQSVELKPPSPWSLYAILSLGLLHDDIDLATLALKDLHKLRHNKKILHHYAVLLIHVHLLQEQYEVAVRELAKLIHQYPDQASLWLSLSLLLVRIYKQKPTLIKSAAHCAHLAMKLGRTTMDITKVFSVVSLASFLSCDQEYALKSAQKAVHCFPDIPESWSVLIFVLKFASKRKEIKKEWLENSIIHIRNNLNCKTTLDEWLERQYLRLQDKSL